MGAARPIAVNDEAARNASADKGTEIDRNKALGTIGSYKVGCIKVHAIGISWICRVVARQGTRQ